MNAGRDVERLIAGWLEEEAQAGAPVRVLDSIRLSIDRTRQRRWIAAWREPVFCSPLRLAGLAAVVAIALVGGAYIGRATAPGGVGGQPNPAATASPSDDASPAVDAFRATRNAICARYGTEIGPLNEEFRDLYDPDLTAGERAPKVAALETFIQQYERMIDELAALEPPAILARDHSMNIAKFEDLASMVNAILARVADGDLVGAEGIDLATEGVAADIEQFESRNVLEPCP